MILIVISCICEFIDSYLGMMYGTILTPMLLILGYDTHIVIPSILLSQAMGGLIATYRHNKLNNAQFKIGSYDFKIASIITLLGILAVALGTYVGGVISKTWLNTYIGALCVLMGLIVLRQKKFTFKWAKIIAIGFISSFNKALSGGGFGPIVASGQIISGRKGKNAIGTTDFAEAPICLMAFAMWVFNKGMPETFLLLPLLTGSCLGGYLGPLALARFRSDKKLVMIIGCLTIFLGVYLLIKTHI